MPEEIAKTQLHIVHQPKRVQISQQEFNEPSIQGMLFPAARRGLMIFMVFPDVTAQEFRQTLERAMPSFVIELRASPRFDIGNLNRQQAFQAFQYQNTTYLDLTSTLMGNADADTVIFNLFEFFKTKKPKPDRPIIFLVNRIDSDEGLVPRVLETLSKSGAEANYVLEVPSFQR